MEVKKRGLKLLEHDISKIKYLELKYFCRQYEEKKQECKVLRDELNIKAMDYSGMPRSKTPGKPTEQTAIDLLTLEKDTSLIEQTALSAGGELYQYIIKNVAYGIPYEHMDIPMGRRQFYDARRYFFYLLSKKR